MSRHFPEAVRVVDSHTEGEPTRVVVDGWPELPGATMADRRDAMRSAWPELMRGVVCEPRGHDAVVGAVLTVPVEAGSTTGVIFFNNVDCLGMCGHGLIGVVETLRHLGRLDESQVRVDTPVGTVAARLEPDGSVTIENVPSFCRRLDVAIEVEGLGPVVGDVAWGGNWFFLVRNVEERLELENLPRLLDVTRRIRDALDRADLLAGEGVIDHVELFGPPRRKDADSRNFVLCPGGEYDRSPCGTGTSAKMAALAARGELEPGRSWRQEGVTGGLFVGSLARRGDDWIPSVRGRAWVTAEATLRFDLTDPLRTGFTAR